MVINYKNVFKDYLDYKIKVYDKSRIKDRMFYSIKEDKAYFTNGHILAIFMDSISPFKTNSDVDFSKVIYKETDKEVFISKDITIVSGIECYVIKDIFENNITYINRKELDRWFDKEYITLYMENLDNKSPIFFHYGDSVVGFQLPVRRV